MQYRKYIIAMLQAVTTPLKMLPEGMGNGVARHALILHEGTEVTEGTKGQRDKT